MSDLDHPVSTFLLSGPLVTQATREVLVARLAHGDTNGWRCDELPSDAKVYRVLLLGLLADFRTLNETGQTLVLTQIQRRHPHVLEDVLAELTESSYANSVNQLGIGYVGFPDAKGWSQTGLNQPDPHEQESLEQAGRQP